MISIMGLMVIDLNAILGAFIVGGMVFAIIQRYPYYRVKIEDMETMNLMPLAVTYIVIHMRMSPTLEGAVRFAARHIKGSLGRDLKKLVWDWQNGHYLSMEQALKDYAQKWYDKNKNFSAAIDVILNTQQIGDNRKRLEMLDKAADVILEGNLETMKGFARKMEMPVLILYMLCIVLPVMGLVIAPIITAEESITLWPEGKMPNSKG